MVGGQYLGRRKTGNHGYDVIVSGELFADYSITSQTYALNPKLKSTGAGTHQLLSRWWDAYINAWPERLLSKSQDAVALQQIRAWRFLPVIDRGDIRQAIDHYSNIWASLPGAGYGQFEQQG